MCTSGRFEETAHIFTNRLRRGIDITRSVLTPQSLPLVGMDYRPRSCLTTPSNILPTTPSRLSQKIRLKNVHSASSSIGSDRCSKIVITTNLCTVQKKRSNPNVEISRYSPTSNPKDSLQIAAHRSEQNRFQPYLSSPHNHKKNCAGHRNAGRTEKAIHVPTRVAKKC